MHDLAISSWNVQGLGNKCNDALSRPPLSLLSLSLSLLFLKHDINILETWKGVDADISIPHYNFSQKFRKGKYKRFSGGIILHLNRINEIKMQHPQKIEYG
jgi:hypothetical protein